MHSVIEGAGQSEWCAGLGMVREILGLGELLCRKVQ